MSRAWLCGKALAVGVVVVVAVLFGLGAPALAARELTIYHWWTAGGERQAIDKLFEVYQKQHPGVRVIDNPIAGGGGITLKTVLMGLLAARTPPDTFQSLSGAELKMYVDGGYIEPVDDLWRSLGLEQKFPEVVARMVRFNGHYYAVPVNAHRANWLFYSKKVFDQLGLKLRTVDDLIATARTISQRMPSVAPIGIGTREKWPAVFLFDTVLLSVGGPDAYERFYTGMADARTDPVLRTALSKFKELIPYMYRYHGVKAWSDVVGPLGNGEMAMMVIGDFAVGFLLQANYRPGVDWDAVPFPQDPEVFLMIVDTFTLPRYAKNPDATRLWLETLTTTEAQREFNVIKGSIAIIPDVPASVYPDPVRRAGSQAFATKRIVPSSIHGVLAPPAFLSDFQDILTRFLYSPDVDRAIEEIAFSMEFNKVREYSAWYWQR